MSGMLGFGLSFLVTCFVAAFVCTAVKEDEDHHLLRGTARLFVLLVLGILGFALAVQAVTLLAG